MLMGTRKKKLTEKMKGKNRHILLWEEGVDGVDGIDGVDGVDGLIIPLLFDCNGDWKGFLPTIIFLSLFSNHE